MASDDVEKGVVADASLEDNVEVCFNDGNSTNDDEDAQTNDATRLRFQLPWSTWSRERWSTTLLGCLSSCIVLTVRLILDTQPTSYLIHSIIVFLDMVLIHFFTQSRWLSVLGELTTILFFLLYHYTHEAIMELLETTLIAA